MDAKKYIKLKYDSEWFENVSTAQAKVYHLKNVAACKRAWADWKNPDRPLRVLAIHGSGRNIDRSCAHEQSNSATILRTGLEALKGMPDVEVEDVELRKYLIEPCNCCVSSSSVLCGYPCDCFPMGPMQKLYPKVIRADVLLMSTGVNQSMVSTRLKAFADRLISCFLESNTLVFGPRGYKPIKNLRGKHKLKGAGRAIKLLDVEGKWRAPTSIIHNDIITYSGLAYRVTIDNGFGEKHSFLTTDDHQWPLVNGGRLRSDELIVGSTIKRVASKCVNCDKVMPLTTRATCSNECLTKFLTAKSIASRLGKTYEEWLGDEKGKALREKRARQLKQHNPAKNLVVREKLSKSSSRSWSERIKNPELVKEMKKNAAARIKKVHEQPDYSEKLSKSLRESAAVKAYAEARTGITEEERFGPEKARNKNHKKIFSGTVDILKTLTDNHRDNFVIGEAKVVSIETEHVTNMRKYCFTVDSTHSFVVAGGIVSGNCDGGIFRPTYRAKDEEFKRLCQTIAARGDFSYSPRLSGKVCAYFISSKDHNNSLGLDQDGGFVTLDYEILMTHSLRSCWADYGCLHAEPWYAFGSTNPHEEYQYDKAYHNKDTALHQRAKDVVKAAVALAKKVKAQGGHSTSLTRINRT